MELVKGREYLLCLRDYIYSVPNVSCDLFYAQEVGDEGSGAVSS